MRGLYQRYITVVRPELQRELGLSNVLSAPKIVRIVLDVGCNVNLQKDPKFLETVERTLARITGQRAVATRAKKSVASFKIRQNQVVGFMVTLRGQRMWDFLEKLIVAVLPRTRDFWGISEQAVDASGNLSIGFKEHLAFPEIRSDEVERIHGLGITVVACAKSREAAIALYRLLGVPLKKE